MNEETNPNAESTQEVSEEQVQESISDQGDLSETDKLAAELADMKDKYLRLYSEFDNFRKRTAKERIDLISTANEGLILSLLPVVDDFERALKSFEVVTEVGPLKEGITLISQKLYKTLESKGLKPVDSINQPFDTELHEAITQIPAPSEDMKGKVIDQVEKGYYLGEKVIRFAKVVIGA